MYNEKSIQQSAVVFVLYRTNNLPVNDIFLVSLFIFEEELREKKGAKWGRKAEIRRTEHLAADKVSKSYSLTKVLPKA